MLKSTDDGERAHEQSTVLVKLRWILFLPGGLIAGVILSIIDLLTLNPEVSSTILGIPVHSEIAIAFLSIVFGSLEGAFTISFSALIAPSYNKKVPTTIAATFFCTIFLIFILINISVKDWYTVMQYAFAFATAIISAVYIVQNEDKTPNSVV